MFLISPERNLSKRRPLLNQKRKKDVSLALNLRPGLLISVNNLSKASLAPIYLQPELEIVGEGVVFLGRQLLVHVLSDLLNKRAMFPPSLDVKT